MLYLLGVVCTSDESLYQVQISFVVSGTTQKKETAEEGFTNEDGSVVVSKKMTRVVTTTKTTLPGEQARFLSGEAFSRWYSPIPGVYLHIA